MMKMALHDDGVAQLQMMAAMAWRLKITYAREALMGKEARRARVNFTQTYIHIICDIFRDLLAWKDRKHNQHLDTCITSISTTDDVDKTRRFKHHVIFRHQQFQATQAKTRVP
jgi:hypothetical protein